MYNNNSYTAFLRAKPSFPYPYPYPPPSSDHDLRHAPYNPYCTPSTYQRLPLITGQQFPRQSALLYFAPSRTFIAAAATYLATTRRPRAGLSHNSGSTSCCVTVRETRCCHSHCFCDGTSSSFRETRSCNKGRGQKLLGREVIQARQVWRCDEDYECECGRSELVERDLRRKERSVEPRVSNNARIEECFDYREIDNSRQRDDETRKFNRMRRHRCECDCEDDEWVRLSDQRRRRDEYDNTCSDRRRRAECDDYVDNERVRLSNRRRRRDEYDDNVRFSDQRRRAAYDDYDEREDVRNREDRIRVASRTEMEEYDLAKADNYRRRRDDQIKFFDRKRDNRINVSDRRRTDGSYDNHKEDRVRVSDRRRKDEYHDYDEEDKVRVSDQRRRDNYNERSNNIRVTDRRKDESYDYDEEDYKRREEDQIRVSDRRRREVDDEKDDKIKVSDRRRRDEYYDFDDEDRIRVSDRRRNNGYKDYDNEDNIRVSDRRRKDVRYDYDGEDRVRVSDQRRSAGYYDYDHGDDIRISDRKRSDRHYDYDNEDNIRVSDRRRRNVYYDYDDEDRVIVTDRRRKDVSDERDNSLRVMDNRRRDEHYAYNEDDRIRVSDRRRRDEDYNFTEEDKIRVFNQKRKEVLNSKDNRIHNSDNRIREEADDYEEVFTDLQRRGNAARVSDSKLERQSRFKESRDEASTSQIRQTEEREGKYREKREHFDQKSLREGSQFVKIISEDDSSLLSRERKNAVNKLETSEAQLNLQSRTQIGMQRQNVDSSSLVESQVAMQKDKNNTLNQFTVSEVETNVQNRTHIGTDRKQVETSSSVQNQVQVIRDKKNYVNQLTVNKTQLDLQLRSNVDVQRKMVDASSTVQNVNQVVRNKDNVQNQLTISEAESDVQNRTRIEAERRRVDASTSVQDVTQVVRGKQNIVNPPLTMSELESNIQEINRIEAEKRRVDLDTSVQNVTQTGRQKQELVDRLAGSEVESNLQNRSQTEAERRVVDTATTIQNVTEVTNEKNNVVNQLTVHETEVNVLNETDINLTRVYVNDASTHIDNLSTGTGSETSTALIQQTEISSERVGSSSLTAGSSSFKGSLESASRLEKSSSYHVGRFVDSVHEELLSGSAKKSPSESLSDPKISGAHGTFQTAAGTETENTVARRQGKSLWAFVADIMKLGFLKDEARQSRSGRRSSSSGSRGTDDWFSGQEEVDTETKNEDEQPSIENPPESDPSALVKDPEVDLTAIDDGTVIPTLQEKTVVEDVRGHESTSIIGETDNLSSTTTSELHGSGVVGSTFRLGEKIVKEEIPMIARQITEKRTKGGYSSDMQASVAGGSSMLEKHVSGITETSDGGESKRRMQLKRTIQVPKSSFDEWEEEHSTQIDTPAIDYAGVTIAEGLASGVAGVSEVSTSLGSAILGFQPSRVSGQPSASAFSASAASNLHLSGDTGIEMAGGLRMEKQLKRIARVQSKSIDEYEETKMGESTTSTTDSTVVITELPESGAVEGHEIVDKGGRKHLRRLSQAPRESFEEWEEAYIREKEQRRLDEFFMREALVEAQRASDSWEVPVGAVLVRNGEVIARGCNLVEELRDSTAHAEMVCIREASNLLHSWRLSDTTLYVTLEPCAMCAGAILQARVDTVVWGAPNKLLGADGSWVRLFPGDAETSSSLNPPPVQQTGPVHPFHPKITIRRGILEDECSEIMQQFFKLRRKKKSTKPESSSTKPANPLKFFSRFTGMFCV